MHSRTENANNVQALLIGALVMLIASCETRPAAAPGQNNKLGALAVMYGKYLASHSGKAPANQKEFAAFINDKSGSTLKQFGYSNADELFNAGGGDSIVVDYGTANVSGPNPIIAYEAAASGDKRRVIRANAAIEEMPESDFQREKPTGAKK